MLISLLVTVLVFAFLISNFPVPEGIPEKGPVADAGIHNGND
jgi:hypothetical protein